MSRVVDIESAIERLSAGDLRQLQEKLASRGAQLPKTGAELAKLWPCRFHLLPEEADALAEEMNGLKKPPCDLPARE